MAIRFTSTEVESVLCATESPLSSLDDLLLLIRRKDSESLKLRNVIFIPFSWALPRCNEGMCPPRAVGLASSCRSDSYRGAEALLSGVVNGLSGGIWWRLLGADTYGVDLVLNCPDDRQGGHASRLRIVAGDVLDVYRPQEAKLTSNFDLLAVALQPGHRSGAHFGSVGTNAG